MPDFSVNFGNDAKLSCSLDQHYVDWIEGLRVCVEGRYYIFMGTLYRELYCRVNGQLLL